MLGKSLAELPEMFVTGDARFDGHFGWVVVHAPEACVPPCAMHAPSNHKLNGAPIVFRPTVFGYIACRVCEHGSEHFDPDAIAYLRGLGVALRFDDECECGCCPEDL